MSVHSTMEAFPRKQSGRIQISSAFYFIFFSKAMRKTNAAFFEGLVVWGGVDAFSNSTVFVSRWHAS